MPALAAGLLALRFLAELPSVGWLLGMAAAGLLLLFGRLYWLGLFLLGFAWACGSAQVALDGRLAAELDGRTLWLEGRVVDLPASGEGVTRFRLEEVSAARGVLLPERLRLSWRGAPPLMGGERWRLAVTLKRPRGLVNAAGFDYEAWLLAQRVGAVGTVKAGQRLQPASGLDAWRDAWRQRLLAVDAQGRGAALAALVLGDGSGLSAAEWRMFQDTGTVHLMVISGSHISLLAGLLYGLVAALHRLGCWPRRLPWLPCACALGLLGAWSYGLMAGFEVPVRRACLMVSLALVWRLRFRHLGLLTPLLATLVLVGTGIPLVMLGYWLYEGSSASFPLMEIASTLLSSLSLAFGGALLSCLLALPVSILVVRYPGALARWTQRLPYLLQALPGLVIALSLVYFSLHYLPATYQTTGLLLVAYALLFMPLTQAPIRVALEKASPQLEEAARTLGQTPLMAFLRITLPIISPAIGAGFVLVFLDTMKELTATLVLGPTGLSTLATSVWVHTANLEYAAAAPYAALLILISGLPVYLLTTRAHLSTH
nr:ComEC/Rec2 family competence protein [Pseudomonas aeruginosa]